MYGKRIKIFISVSIFLLVVCLLRLVQMQLQPGSAIQDKIRELKLRQGLYRQLRTTRGRILDGRGRVLAVDRPHFYIGLSYELTRFADGRYRELRLLRARLRDDSASGLSEVRTELGIGLEELRHTIDKCSRFGPSYEQLEKRTTEINNAIWRIRRHLAWKRNYPNQDFAQAVPDANERLLLTGRVDIAEMHKLWPVAELKTSDDIFTAQMEFSEVDGVGIVCKGRRVYPYGVAAAQTIGWVGRAIREADKELFEHDRLLSYLDDELCGREDGVEFVCESVLRGRRGELMYDIDGELVSSVETRPGRDVRLTIDIELQKKIEEHLTDCGVNDNCRRPTAAVVIDVNSCNILALVSTPRFDLNRVRQDYGYLAADGNQPLLNRAINKEYPPGSVVKPLILIAGMESGKIDTQEIISCPAQKAARYWPSCWVYNRFKTGHDGNWANNGRNAIKGSCNIYFSHLADRIEPFVLQGWLYSFGYGRKAPLAPPPVAEGSAGRQFRRQSGVISSTRPARGAAAIEQLPALRPAERRYFGIGQGNLRATPLQVANSIAAIARGGRFRWAKLFVADANDSGASDEAGPGISAAVLEVVLDGMSAVVNEPGGTAYPALGHAGFTAEGMSIYGKTGSTQAPAVAWFAGFAGDGAGRSIAVAVVVEGGEHGSSDAAPLARDIISFCIETGYLHPRGW